MQNSLIKRLIEKFKANNAELSKKAASLALAGTMALSGLGLSACKNGNNTTNPGTSTSQPNTSENGNSSGSTTQKPDYSKYSQILQTVLTDPYYNSLISVDKSNTGTPISYQNPEYYPIPYGFLVEEGFSISKVRSGELFSQVDVYTINNDLYIELKVEVESSINYLANYVLKYTLTNQERNELDSLFANLGTNNRTTYYQAPFFVQELSMQKEAEIISVAYITKDSLKATESYLSEKAYISAQTAASYQGSVVTENNITYHTFLIHQSTNNVNSFKNPQNSYKRGVITLRTLGTGIENISNIDVYTNTQTSAYRFLEEYKQKFNDSLETVLSYSCVKAYFKDVKKGDSLEIDL